MRPLIPRVRPGDILKGTRNLRNYLSTASTLSYLHQISTSARHNRARKRQIYRPSKSEQFLVTVNVRGVFAVYAMSESVILFFANGREDATPKPFALSNGLTVPRKKINYRFGNPESDLIRMDPTIFSQWFIRTPGKITNVRHWPSYAHYMWMALHLNMVSIVSAEAPLFHIMEGPAGPFEMAGHETPKMWTREALVGHFRRWVVRGVTRPNNPWHQQIAGGTFGPQLKDIAGMRRTIQELCTNPRTAKTFQEEEGSAFKAFIQDISDVNT